jgi:beta-glucanase (GH16 family)
MKALPRLSHPRRAAAYAAGALLLAAAAAITAPASGIPATTVPSAPENLTATRGNASAVIAWDAPVADGGTPITAFVVSAVSGDPTVTAQVTGTARTATITGLANGVTYAISVIARNSVGDSLPAGPVTVQPSRTAAKVPAAPVISQVIAGSQSLLIPFSLGADNGSTIIATEWSIDNGTTWTPVLTSPVSISGLRNGTAYTVKLRSRNRLGASPAASKSGKPVPAKNLIVFTQPADMGITDPAQTMDISSTGGVTVVKTSTPKVCAIDGFTLTPLAIGSCKITASNSGDAYYAAATAVTRTVTIAALPPGKVLLWAEEFKGTAGSSPAATTWSADTGDGCTIGNCGWGNNERQYYTPGANTLDGTADGNLIITAQRAGANNNRCYYGRCEWTSGKITSNGKVSFTYGQLEARIKVPAGGGTWPAFWMLGSNIGSVGWPRCGELDILEAVGNSPQTVWGTAHMANNNGARVLKGGTTVLPSPLSDGYHVFAVNWTPTSITWLFDGKSYFTVTKTDFGFPTWPFGPAADGTAPRMYAIFNIAMGGDMGGAIAPSLQSASMAVDWVRYYSMNGVGTVNK